MILRPSLTWRWRLYSRSYAVLATASYRSNRIHTYLRRRYGVTVGVFIYVCVCEHGHVCTRCSSVCSFAVTVCRLCYCNCERPIANLTTSDSLVTGALKTSPSFSVFVHSATSTANDTYGSTKVRRIANYKWCPSLAWPARLLATTDLAVVGQSLEYWLIKTVMLMVVIVNANECTINCNV